MHAYLGEVRKLEAYRRLSVECGESVDEVWVLATRELRGAFQQGREAGMLGSGAAAGFCEEGAIAAPARRLDLALPYLNLAHL